MVEKKKLTKIINFIINDLKKISKNEKISTETNLTRLKSIDSLQLLIFITKIEKKYKIRFNSEIFLSKKNQNIKAIAQYIYKNLK